MSHLHIPDGLIPVWLWGSGLGLALILVVRTSRAVPDRRVAYQGALGGLMLAAMSIPLGPLDYHLTLAGPAGVLLGAAAGFQAAFVVSVILAFMGHGGFTVLGWNALVLGAAAAVASGVHRTLVSRLGPARTLAAATFAAQVAAGALWLLVMWASLGFGNAAILADHAHEQLGLFAGLSLPLWILGVAIETLVAYGLGRFLVRVHPALLQAPA